MAGCCRFQTFLVWLQIFLGLVLTGLCVYLHVFVDVITLRDKPFWAGIPLFLSGIFGTSFIGHSKNEFGSSSTCRFVFKIFSFIMALIATCTCLTSLVFIAMHVYRLLSYSHCRHVANGCLCFSHVTEGDNGHLYFPVRDCHVLFCEIKAYLCSMVGLCVAASVTTLSYLVSIWKSVYGATGPGAPHNVETLTQAPGTSITSHPYSRQGLTELGS